MCRQLNIRVLWKAGQAPKPCPCPSLREDNVTASRSSHTRAWRSEPSDDRAQQTAYTGYASPIGRHLCEGRHGWSRRQVVEVSHWRMRPGTQDRVVHVVQWYCR